MFDAAKSYVAADFSSRFRLAHRYGYGVWTSRRIELKFA